MNSLFLVFLITILTNEVYLASYNQKNDYHYQPSAKVTRAGNIVKTFFSFFKDGIIWLLNGIKDVFKTFVFFDWCKLTSSLKNISDALVKAKGDLDNGFDDVDDDHECNAPGSSVIMVVPNEGSCNDCFSDCKPGKQRPDYCRDKTDPQKMTVISDLSPTPPNWDIDENEE
ncbi:uncharacterized protein LOC123292786 [Chrysoperla carnea]|uniref:uncharacterized protein LOC123292786 n=1 Tax=Chrysoperla carnea TaxID=189513 RepID=UPI001D0710A6|nr:uncharacterized protein LOC123292786 [Chrysoperla carnea]